MRHDEANRPTSQVHSQLEHRVHRRYLVRVVRESVSNLPAYPVRSARDVYSFLGSIQSSDRESFYCLHLDARRRVVSCEEVSRGGLDSSPVHPREVYKAAIVNSAAAIIVAHNHPSGDPTPSCEDRNVTKRLQDSGELLGIPLLDHVIIGERSWFSVADEQFYAEPAQTSSTRLISGRRQ